MSAKISKALNRLMYLVSSGMEYPDAEWRVQDSFKLSSRDVDHLREAYDACFE